MKKFIVFIFASAILSSFHSFAQKQYQVLAVGFYNCENFFDTTDDPNKKDEDFTPNGPYHYTAEVYSQKLHNIATVMKAMGTDVTPNGAAIIGMAEVENDKVLGDLINQPELKARGYQYIWFPTPDERGISTAMLYNPNFFQVLHAQPIHVALESIGMTRPTRDVLFVTGILGGDTVNVLVNHWPSKYGGDASNPGRIVAAQTDKHIIDSLQKVNPSTRILLLGDLNDNPTSPGVTEVLRAKEDKKTLATTDIYNPWIAMYKKGAGSEFYKGEANLIDQIMLSAPLVNTDAGDWRYYKCEIFKKDFMVNKLGENRGLPHRSFTINQVWDNGYSDHFPVLVYLVKEAK